MVHFNILLQIRHTSGRINLDVWPSAENVVQTFSWPGLVIAGALQPGQVFWTSVSLP